MDNLFFDWYSASIDSPPDSIIEVLKSAFPHGTLEPDRPRHGYTHGDKLVDQSGETISSLWYGGSRQGTNVYTYASGSAAPRFSEVIRSAYPDHELVRSDVAIDYDEPGAYLSLFDHGIKTARSVSVKDRYIGPAGSERLLDCPDGRSLYIGSRSSTSMFRIYEKGKKDDKTRPNWVRAEFEFKPKNRAARLYYAKASIQEIVSATKLGRAFFQALGVAVQAAALSPGTVRTKTDHDRAMEHLLRQYGKTLLREFERHNGDYESFGRLLAQVS